MYKKLTPSILLSLFVPLSVSYATFKPAQEEIVHYTLTCPAVNDMSIDEDNREENGEEQNWTKISGTATEVITKQGVVIKTESFPASKTMRGYIPRSVIPLRAEFSQSFPGWFRCIYITPATTQLVELDWQFQNINNVTNYVETDKSVSFDALLQ